jgi:hypothetical protein
MKYGESMHPVWVILKLLGEENKFFNLSNKTFTKEIHFHCCLHYKNILWLNLTLDGITLSPPLGHPVTNTITLIFHGLYFAS